MIERTNLTRDGLAPLLDKVPAYFDFMVIELPWQSTSATFNFVAGTPGLLVQIAFGGETQETWAGAARGADKKQLNELGWERDQTFVDEVIFFQAFELGAKQASDAFIATATQFFGLASGADLKLKFGRLPRQKPSWIATLIVPMVFVAILVLGGLLFVDWTHEASTLPERARALIEERLRPQCEGHEECLAVLRAHLDDCAANSTRWSTLIPNENPTARDDKSAVNAWPAVAECFNGKARKRVFDPVCVKTKVIPSDFRRFNQGNPYQPKLDLPIGR